MWLRFLLCAVIYSLSAQTLFASPSYTMRHAVEQALRENPGIKAAQAGIEEGASALSKARADFGPSLSTAYGYTASNRNLSSTSGKDQYLWSASATQELFSGFKHLSALEKSRLGADQKDLLLAAGRLNTIAAVQGHFLEYLKAQENIRSAKDALERLRSQLEVTRAFYREGLRPNLDVLQAEADVSRAELTLIQAENAKSTQTGYLNTLLNLPVDSQVSYIGALGGAVFTMSLNECLEYAYTHRPDLRIARLAVEMAGEDRKIAQSEYYPKVSAGLNWSSKGDSPKAAGSSRQPTGYTQNTAGLTAEWRFFDSGRTLFADQEAKHRQSRLREEYEQARQDLANRIHTQFLGIQDAKRRIEVAIKSLRQSTEAFQTAVARYRSQLGTNTDVLDAQSKMTEDEAYLTGARADYLSTISLLYATMGKEHTNLLNE